MSLRDAAPPLPSTLGTPDGTRPVGAQIRRRWLGPRRSPQRGASVLILQHQDNASPGLLLDVLRARRLAWRTAHLDRA